VTTAATSTATEMIFGTGTAVPIRFVYNNSEQMRLTSTGLGIGTSSPAYRLDVSNGGVSGSKLFKFTGAAAGGSLFGYSDAGGVGITRTDPYNSMVYLSTANTVEIYTASTQRAVFDAAGNLGLGVTPSAWATSGTILKAMEFGAYGGNFVAGASGFAGLFVGANAYFNGTNWIYKTTGGATYYNPSANTHSWWVAPSGTAGNAITFTQAMTLSASGGLNLIGTGNPGAGIYSGAGWQSNGVVFTTAAAIYNGVYAPSDSVIAIATAGSERARIDSSGNLLVGTTSSNAAKAYVQGIVGSSSGYRWDGASQGARGLVTTASSLYTTSSDGTSYGYGVSTNIAGGLDIMANQGGQDIRFWCGTSNASPSERMRIDASGNLLVGNTSAYLSTNTFFKTGGAGQPVLFLFKNSVSTSTDQAFCVANGLNGGTVSFQVLANGNAQNTNNSYGAISDAKLKENVTDATPKLEKLNQVRVVNYNLKINPEQKLLGVIAQELEQIFPGIVDELPDHDKEGNDLGTTTKSVRYSVFVPMLIKAMQEQQAIIEDMKTRLTAAGI
jgi:Chaperone of endosialidase